MKLNTINAIHSSIPSTSDDYQEGIPGDYSDNRFHMVFSCWLKHKKVLEDINLLVRPEPQEEDILTSIQRFNEETARLSSIAIHNATEAKECIEVLRSLNNLGDSDVYETNIDKLLGNLLLWVGTLSIVEEAAVASMVLAALG